MTDPQPIAPPTDLVHRSRGPGRLLVAAGIAGLVLSLVASIAAWRLVDGAVDSIDDSLELTDEALVALSDTIEVAGDALGSTGGGLAAVQAATSNLDTALATTADVLTELDIVLAETVPSGIDSIRQPIGTLALTSRVLTDVLGGLALFGLDFQPDAPLDESVRAIDQELSALAEQLRNPDARLGRVGDDFATISADLAELESELSDLTDTVGRADVLLSGYEGTAARATMLIATARDELAARRTLARGLVVLIAALLALAQLGPIAVGRRWMIEDEQAEVSATPMSGMSRS